MTQTRRSFLTHAGAAVGLITVLPFSARAAGHMSDVFADGAITVHPIAHASFVMETPAGVIYVDPVGDAASYESLPSADYILITHEHGDHYNVDTLTALKGDATQMITNPAVFEKLPEGLRNNTQVLANGESAAWGEIGVDAIPAYNTTEERMNFHPEGRDNGYIVTLDGFRTYISGDTEPTPEMLALTDIDLAFLCMNLPFTQTAQQAAEAVKVFKPTYVYPYHYQGRDGGTQDPEQFAELVGGASEVKIGDWYGDHSHG
ncbi:secreted protein [Pacificibacter maritimus]|uniref:Secreted protein n=1 Tax=Pacificibacter maritimus TaxID=762213 RepID=A0A3N4U862_9RHOB|nr:MBL fold metallo-hydrolase [Pacificibacter maritimus]RPE63291.1 secreted protein [Pacificibacter maritimus]